MCECWRSGLLLVARRWSSSAGAELSLDAGVRGAGHRVPHKGRHLLFWQHQHRVAQGLREPSLPYPASVVTSGVLRLHWMAFAGPEERGWHLEERSLHLGERSLHLGECRLHLGECNPHPGEFDFL